MSSRISITSHGRDRAMMTYLYFPAQRSAALRKMAALSFQGMSSHSRWALTDDSIACWTSSGDARWYLHNGAVEWE